MTEQPERRSRVTRGAALGGLVPPIGLYVGDGGDQERANPNVIVSLGDTDLRLPKGLRRHRRSRRRSGKG